MRIESEPGADLEQTRTKPGLEKKMRRKFGPCYSQKLVKSAENFR